MLNKTICSIFIIASTSITASSQIEYSIPAGFVTIEADAAIDSSTPTYSYVSHSLAREKVIEEAVSSSTTNTITIDSANWSLNEFTSEPHFVIIKEGDLQGKFYDISSHTTDTITLQTGGESVTGIGSNLVAIYKHGTLASIFGENPAAAITTNPASISENILTGASATTADQILLFNNTGSFETYFYMERAAIGGIFPSPAISRWIVTSDANSNARNTIIPLTSGIVILRRSTTPFKRKIYGQILDSVIELQAYAGSNLITIPFPIDTEFTLGDPELELRPAAEEDYDPSIHLISGNSQIDADQIQIWNGTGYDTYFYLEREAIGGLFPSPAISQWVKTSDININASSTILPHGGFFIIRKPGSPPFLKKFANLAASE